MKKIYTLLVIFFLAGSSFMTVIPLLSLNNLKALSGNWSGTLTYLDYSSGKPYTMEANIRVAHIARNDSSLTFSYVYPKEPKANEVDTLTISQGGKYLDGARLVEVKLAPNKDFELMTESAGTDGNDGKKAVIRKTYILKGSSFTIRKDVKFDDSKTWINRHIYDFVRH